MIDTIDLVEMLDMNDIVNDNKLLWKIYLVSQSISFHGIY